VNGADGKYLVYIYAKLSNVWGVFMYFYLD